MTFTTVITVIVFIDFGIISITNIYNMAGYAIIIDPFNPFWC